MTEIEERIRADFSDEIIGVIPLSIIQTTHSVINLINFTKILESTGFTVLNTEPYLDFRLQYEEQYRDKIELNEIDGFSLVIVTEESIDSIDFDLFKIAEAEHRIFNYTFPQFFPDSLIRIETLSRTRVETAEEWFSFSEELGKAIYDFYSSETYYQYNDFFMTIINTINHNFLFWCDKKYSSILSGFIKPKSLNNLLPHIAYELRKKKHEKVALLIFDGMAFDQWELLQKEIATIRNVQVETSGLFSMIPSLTSVSRQAIFSGKLPKDYPDSIRTTHKESALWDAFWKKEKESNAVYIRPQEDFSAQLLTVYDALNNDQTKIIGTVISGIDELMHNMDHGYSQLYKSMEIWLKDSGITTLIRDLLLKDFFIYITADHGNLEALPGNKINEGVLADTKGQRVRIYDRESARENIIDKYDNLHKIDSTKYALPDDFYAVVQENAEYFGSNGRIITHGGLSVQEVIVPFIRITENK